MDKKLKELQDKINALQDIATLREELHRKNGSYVNQQLRKMVREGSEKIVLYRRLFFAQKNLKKIISALGHDRPIKIKEFNLPLARIEKSILKRISFLNKYKENKSFHKKVINDFILIIFQLNEEIRTEINYISKSQENKSLPDKLYFIDNVLTKKNSPGFFNFIKIDNEAEIMKINQK